MAEHLAWYFWEVEANGKGRISPFDRLTRLEERKKRGVLFSSTHLVLPRLDRAGLGKTVGCALVLVFFGASKPMKKAEYRSSTGSGSEKTLAELVEANEEKGLFSPFDKLRVRIF